MVGIELTTVVGQTAPVINTLTEPISTTVYRDLKSIGTKLRYVMLPVSRTEKMQGLRDWDLWGPFMLCIILSFILSSQAGKEQSGEVFALVFVLMWAGSAVVTVNAALLKANVSFFQSVCVLGYCCAPLTVAALVCAVVNQINAAWMKLLVVFVGFLWGSTASVGFFESLVAEQRRALVVYPVFLFYLALAWVILVA